MQVRALRIRADEFAKGRNLRRQCGQQLSQCFGVHFKAGQTGTLARNTEKLNVHSLLWSGASGT